MVTGEARDRAQQGCAGHAPSIRDFVRTCNTRSVAALVMADGRRTIWGDGGWTVRLAVVPVRPDDRSLAARPRAGPALHRRGVDRSGVAGAAALGARGRRRAVAERRTGLPRRPG